jgi:hypothetical protein
VLCYRICDKGENSSRLLNEEPGTRRHLGIRGTTISRSSLIAHTHKPVIEIFISIPLTVHLHI